MLRTAATCSSRAASRDVPSPSISARMPTGLTLALAEMQPAPPVAAFIGISDSDAEKVSIRGNASITALVFSQSPELSFRPAMVSG